MPLYPISGSSYRDHIYSFNTCLSSFSLVPSIVLLTGDKVGNKTDGNPRLCAYLPGNRKKRTVINKFSPSEIVMYQGLKNKSGEGDRKWQGARRRP
jgi:hypothetical protein